MFISLFAPLKGLGETKQQKLSLAWFGFSQITMEAGDGLAKMADKSDNGLRFGADRVRFGFRGRYGNTFSKLQVDFNRNDISQVTAGMPEIIKDAEVGYTFGHVTSFKVGMYKTPMGMDFNTSGTKLDITKRGMEKALVLERSLGAMVSGREIGPGFGYDLGFFNPSTRSMAVDGGTAGDEYSYAFRGHYDRGKTIHAETSYGLSKAAGGAGTEDYSAWDAAASYKSGQITLKSEYIAGKNIGGVDEDNQQVWFFHVGYQVTPMFEPVIRYYQGNTKPGGGNLSNTFVGLNVFLNPLERHTARIQLNYVVTGGNKDAWTGLGGVKDDTFLGQVQFAF